MNLLTQSLQTAANLFLQQTCPLCDRTTAQAFCPSCWHQLQQCKRGQPAVSIPDAMLLWAWGTYQHSLKQAIAALKYENHPQLAQPLGHALGALWCQYPVDLRRLPLVVPIPVHAQKRQERGFNQAELIARAFCDRTGLPLAANGLVRQKATAPQFGLGLRDRQQNLNGAFTPSRQFQRRPPARPVLLVDDIYTTGTTVRAAARTLRRTGISVCGIAVVAQTEAGRDQ